LLISSLHVPLLLQNRLVLHVQMYLRHEEANERSLQHWKLSTMPQLDLSCSCVSISLFLIPYRLGFSPQPQNNILVSHSGINPAPWKYLIYTNPAQGFLPDRLQNTPRIPVFQSRTPKINRYFSCAQSPRRAKNDIFAR